MCYDQGTKPQFCITQSISYGSFPVLHDFEADEKTDHDSGEVGSVAGGGRGIVLGRLVRENTVKNDVANEDCNFTDPGKVEWCYITILI